MILHFVVSIILVVGSIFVAPEATAAKKPCSALKGDIQAMLNAPYSGAEADTHLNQLGQVSRS